MKTRTVALAFGLTASAIAAAFAGGFELEPKPVKTYERPKAEGAVTAVCWSTKGEFLASAGEKGWVYTWDAATGEQKDRMVHGPPMRGAYVSCVAAYPLAPIFAHCSEFGVKFNIVGRHAKIPTLDIPLKGTCTALDFSADGDRMVTGDKSGQVVVWDLWTNQALRTFETVKKFVFWVKYHPDGNRVAAACGDGKVRVWDGKENKLLYQVDADAEECYAVDWSADGEWLATGGKDKKIKLWAAADGKAGAVLEGHEDVIEVIAFHPTKGSALLASGSKDKSVRVWDTVAKKELAKLPHDAEVDSVAWRPDGGALATGAAQAVQVFEVKK
jgi:WD40 repeat protein